MLTVKLLICIYMKVLNQIAARFGGACYQYVDHVQLQMTLAKLPEVADFVPRCQMNEGE